MLFVIALLKFNELKFVSLLFVIYAILFLLKFLSDLIFEY
jgi:hypothetical protein